MLDIRVIQVMNFTMDGIPMVYCGNELCDETKLSMFANRFHPGRFHPTDRSDESKSTPQAKRRQEILRTMNSLRREDALFRHGEVAFWDGELPEMVTGFSRTLEERKVRFFGNFGSDSVTFALPGKPEDVILSEGAKWQDGMVTLSDKGYLLYFA